MTDACKRVALRLHSFSAEDRRWVLAALTVSQREIISRYLVELGELGLLPESSASIASEFMYQSETEAPAEVENELLDIRTINGATVTEMQTVLTPESEEFRRLVIDMHPWEWAKTGASVWSSHQGNTRLTSVPIKRAVRQAIAKVLAERLVEIRGGESALPGNTARDGKHWQSLIRRARGMLRA